MNEASSKDTSYNVVVIAAIFLLGSFITFLNSTFMNVALPDIMKDLNVSISTVQWLSTGYMLALGIIIPFTAGRLTLPSESALSTFNISEESVYLKFADDDILKGYSTPS